MQRDELAGWLRLALLPGVGRGGARRLLAAFGLPHQLFSRSHEELAASIPDEAADRVLAAPEGWAESVDTAWAWLQQSGPGPAVRRIVSLADPDYPPSLLQTEDPPLLLYLHGVPVATWPRGIAVVGSRNPTPQGALNAREFGRALAQAGLTVVSGLALGVDGAAHEGALEGAREGQLATIAVIGTGADRVYPARHRDLAHRIVQRGVIVSEYPLGTHPLPPNFPQRNRIIAALGEGTLVVEAALQSGSLITARQALEQGRDVFAVPGSIHSPQSRGCHELLRQGAKLVETAQDVLDELPGFATPKPKAKGSKASAPPPAPAGRIENPLLEAMGFDPTSLDALVARTGMPASQLQAKLLELELSGEVARLPGGRYQRQSPA